MVYRPNVDETLCFVLMPFRQPFNEYYREIIAPTVEDAGLVAVRADDIFGANIIIDDIWERIWRARVVIADVTDKNPNVNYELGLCHALGVPTILITKRIEDLPFDYHHRRCIVYNTEEVSWIQKLRTELSKAIKAVLEDVEGKEPLTWPYNTLAATSASASPLSNAEITGRSRAPWRRFFNISRLWLSIPLLLALSGVVIVTAYLTRRRETQIPSFQRLTFRRGYLQSARFLENDIVYSAEWDGEPCALYRSHPNSTEHRPKETKSDECLLAVSRNEELAILRSPRVEGIARYRIGVLAHVSLTGGEPVDSLSEVRFADWSPDERLARLAPDKRLAAIHDVGNKRRIEFPIGNVLYESENDLYNLRFSPTGNLIAFFERTNKDGRFSLMIIGLDGKPRSSSHGWYDWWGLAWSPKGDEVIFAASVEGTESTIFAINLQGDRRIVYRAPGILEVQDVSRDGKILVVRTDLRQSLAFQRQNEKSGLDLSWLDQSRPADLSADGQTVLIGEHGEGGKGGAIFLRELNGSSTPQQIGEGHAWALSPDRKWVLAVHKGSVELWPREKDSPKKPPFNLGSLTECSWANWFSDSQRVLLSCKSGEHYGLYTLDIFSGNVQPLITRDGDVALVSYGNALSPDNRQVAVVDSYPNGKIMIYTIGGDHPPIEVKSTQPGDRPIQWSADSRSLFFFRRAKDRSPASLNQVDAASGSIVKSTPVERQDRAGTWIGFYRMTPDGQYSCYSYSQTLSDLYLLDGLKVDSTGWR